MKDLDELLGAYHGFRPEQEVEEEPPEVPAWALPVQRLSARPAAEPDDDQNDDRGGPGQD